MSHLKFSPSASDRWMKCPASLNGSAEQGPPSEAAAEGTVAHTICERCLLLGLDPAEMLGEEIDGFTVDQDMVDGARLFLDHVESSLRDLGTDRFHTEIFLQSSEDFGGTVDCLIETETDIAIIDYKYGFRTVEVVNNSQLLCYATLAQKAGQKVTLSIVQPRAAHADGPVRSWEVPADRLFEFGQELEAAFEKAGNEEFSAGDHCRYCPRKQDCPELYQLAFDAAEKDFEAVGETLTPEQAAEILSKRKAVESYFDSIAEVVREKLEFGADVPGFKLVNSFGHRRYCVDEDAIVKACRRKKFGKKQIYESRLMSPAQLEKVVGKDLVNSLVERPLKGTVVVPESDRRPAVERQTPLEMFGEV